LIVAWWELDILCHRLFRADLGTVDLRSLVTARAPERLLACRGGNQEGSRWRGIGRMWSDGLLG
jgi:hypothetical protein